jgi:hypothetical protein
MDSFAGNWDYHREKLVGSMQALGKMVSESKQQFQNTDNKLKTSITPSKK